MNKDRESVIIVRKKKGHGHGHHGGAWKVAFADFMTAMFALFLVLWLVNQSPSVKESVAGYFQNPLGTAEHLGQSPMPGMSNPGSPKPVNRAAATAALRQDLKALEERIKAALASDERFEELLGHVELTLTEEGLRIELLEDSTGVFFESGSATPKGSVAEFLGVLGAQLASLPNAVTIDGHTDAVPYQRAGYGNWELSSDRANTARRIMEAGGLPATQVAAVRGHADRKLRVTGDPRAAQNRRIAILVQMPDQAAPALTAAADSATALGVAAPAAPVPTP
ncbi:MAG: flagellar motor protein MotB [Gemmatimonadales bacterium]|nr:flagellar motor protein MotB [Gemmatimonadales bacterium]